MPSIVNLENKATFPSRPADAINNYFIQITDSLNTKYKNKVAAVSYLQSSFFTTFPKIANIPLIDIEIKNTLISLNNKNLSGYDEITGKVVKVSGNCISKSLVYIFNKLLPESKFQYL
jgi:hypothetical protein